MSVAPAYNPATNEQIKAGDALFQFIVTTMTLRNGLTKAMQLL